MSVGFGFSVGDFLATLKLFSTVIDALRESGASGRQYRELISELYTLESAQLRVQRQTAAQCQQTIDAFWETAAKYQPHLKDGGTGSRIKDGWMKMKWAVCRKEDLETFRADLRGHTVSIALLLLTVQSDNASLHARRQELNHKCLMGRLQVLSSLCMMKLSAILDSATMIVQQGRKLVDSTAQVLQMNVRVFQMLMDNQEILRRMLPQIHGQRPVYLIDAFNKACPFFLESVRSAKALRRK